MGRTENSPFRRQVAKDVQGIFITPDDFSDEIMFEGNALQGILETDEKIDLGPDRTEYPGVTECRWVLYVDQCDLQRPEVESRVEVNGEYCVVKSTYNEMGILKIVLERFAA